MGDYVPYLSFWVVDMPHQVNVRAVVIVNITGAHIAKPVAG
ncbi:hypothetical protein [Snodgrassella sp. CFCC 13594]|nr:hypothetical protein [Snodgrassella sp. CFCC 13594]